jgi:hypothetical protein
MRATLYGLALAAALGLSCKEEREEAREKAHAAGEKVERQPVVGHGPFELYVLDADGHEWLIKDARLVRDIERRLDKKAGLDLKVDGEPDVETQVALRVFQKQRGLDQSGKVDRATARALHLDWDRFLREKAKRQD